MKNVVPVLITTIAVLACVGAAEEGKPDEADIRTVATADLAFATDLYPRLAANGQNIVFCPPGVAGLLAIAGTGSRGSTRTAILSVLHLPGASKRTLEAFGDWRARLASKSDDRITLEWTSTVLSDSSHPLLAAFQDIARLKFNAEIPSVPSLGPGTGLILKSHVHFFGQWTYAFPVADSKPGPFFLGTGGKVSVPFMHSETRFKFFHETGRLFGLGPGGMSLLELPYGNGTYSMVVILPDRRTGLADLEGSLSAATLERWLKALDGSEPTPVILSLPRFDTRSELGLTDALTSMGLGPAGKINVADFSQLSSEPTFISEVMQIATIKTDETGTEATADTVIVLSPLGIGGPPPPEPRVVKVDHPFVFLIRDNTTGAPLFIGRISDPTR